MHIPTKIRCVFNWIICMDMYCLRLIRSTGMMNMHCVVSTEQIPAGCCWSSIVCVVVVYLGDRGRGHVMDVSRGGRGLCVVVVDFLCCGRRCLNDVMMDFFHRTRCLQVVMMYLFGRF